MPEEFDGCGTASDMDLGDEPPGSTTPPAGASAPRCLLASEMMPCRDSPILTVAATASPVRTCTLSEKSLRSGTSSGSTPIDQRSAATWVFPKTGSCLDAWLGAPSSGNVTGWTAALIWIMSAGHMAVRTLDGLEADQ